MYYIYIIKSLKSPEKFYVGYTLNLKQRLETHNSGGSIHTSKYKPWELVMYLCFMDKEKAMEFEKYLKSQSGRAFLKKRFLPDAYKSRSARDEEIDKIEKKLSKI